MGKKISNLITLASALALAWVLISYIDVVSHNMSDQAYAWWNFFTIVFHRGVI